VGAQLALLGRADARRCGASCPITAPGRRLITSTLHCCSLAAYQTHATTSHPPYEAARMARTCPRRARGRCEVRDVGRLTPPWGGPEPPTSSGREADWCSHSFLDGV
jgi:hypothetical protein